MSKRNIAAAFAAALLLAAPAFADGKERRTVKTGPEPLKAQTCPTGQTGYYDSLGRWVCASPAPTRTYTPAPVYTPAPAPTRTYAPAPVYTPAPQPVPAAPSYDFSGFTGGVGANVGSGYYGGGGGFIVETRAPFSGVLSAPAAALTFNKRVIARPMPRPPHRPSHPGHGCGC